MDDVDPIGLEVTRHALIGIAEEAGVALRRAAYSPNIKERMDCSTAVFDPDGGLVAQAEHIPVHLGAMPASLAAAVAAFPTWDRATRCWCRIRSRAARISPIGRSSHRSTGTAVRSGTP